MDTEAPNTSQDFAANVRSKFKELSGEITERNTDIEKRDELIWSDRLNRMLDIPIGHDFTPANWLARTVEVHKNVFMGRGFQVVSTYDAQNIEDAGDDEEERKRILIENGRAKAFAEARMQTIEGIKRDNGGNALWLSLAENASGIGTGALKCFYDEEQKKYVLSEIESIENLYVLWSKDDFRKFDAVAYAYQVSKQEAIRDYGAPDDVQTSPLGKPLDVITQQTTGTLNYSQPMVTILEVTGKIEGWKAEKGELKTCQIGDENEVNVLIIGDAVTRVVSDPKRIPKYYIFPNKRQRRRAWGKSDISDAAIDLNLTWIETFSDWRTHASKVNFQKYKAFNFGADAQLPKYEPRRVQVIPLAEGQDLQPLVQGDSNAQDFKAQMEETENQYVKESGISRVLLDDPSVALNSNQALLTSMKPTSDIAEAKKQLWGPIIQQVFEDALEIVGMWNEDIKNIADPNDNWHLKIVWPSLMNKEDPVFQQMLLNRFNTHTLSMQSYLELQGESKEEMDRIRDEMQDPLLAAIHARALGLLAQQMIAPPQEDKPDVKTSINLRGDLTPYQEANLATQHGFNDGPFPPSAGPQGTQGLYAQENADNADFLTAHPSQGGTPIQRGPDGQPVKAPQQDAGGRQVNTQAQNQEGTGAVSLPGSGQAQPTGAQGAINQTNQNAGG